VLNDVRRRLKGQTRTLALQSKLVIVTTALLIPGGAVLLWLAEHNHSMELARLGLADSLFHALFQSITARTAGFNTLDIGQMSDFGLTILIVLMLVGGSPGSCAGGIKTTTMAVAIFTVVAHLRGREDTEIFGRRVPRAIVQRSFIIISVLLMFIAVTFVVLRVVQLYEPLAVAPGERPHDLVPLAFEVVSAACTVGLSADFTSRLSEAGKVIIALLMFAGRLGPLTLAIALVSARTSARYRLPEERVMVG
jgi:trk system potassium uptake protein TrkH